MTIAPCPHGCGNYVNYADNLNYCPGCRRDLFVTGVLIPEDCDANDPHNWKASWCWQWWGPMAHRMRCRLPKGHEGSHDTHEEREDSVIVSTAGELITADTEAKS